MKHTIVAIVALLATSFFNACKKDNDETGASKVFIRMTDAPASYDAVYIDLQSVVITGDNGNEVTTNVNAGIYNLLDFSNGLDTLIATGSLSSGKLEQVRLILGPNNTIVVNGTSYPLSTPSAEQSGLKLQVHQTLTPGVDYALLLDFDAYKSIVQEGNGQYKLKPVIRTIDVAVSGSIKGAILPILQNVQVSATDGVNTYSSVTDVNGKFLIKGVPTGTYAVTITPVIPLQPVTINNIVVTTGNISDVGTINL